MNAPAHTAPPTSEPLTRRGALLAAAAAVALGGVTVARLSGWQAAEPDAPTLRLRRLLFRDQPDGGIAIVDAPSGHTLETVHGEQGFVRGVLRSMARERRRSDLGAEAPLELLARADGRLTLLDPSTGRRIDLESFGPTNAGVFARWLDMPAPAGPDPKTPQVTK